ncbi:MAG: hypothetical protein ACFFBP_00595 [Promethearchaeota archaeon]
MADIVILSIFDLYINSLAMVLLLFTAFRYFGLARRNENQKERDILKAYISMFFGFASYFILTNISFLFLTNSYEDYLFWGNFENLSLVYIWLTKSAMGSYFGGLLLYFYRYERVMNKKIYSLTIISVIVVLIVFIAPEDFVFYNFQPVIFAIIGLLFLHSLFKLTKWSQKQLRAANSFIIVGSWFMGTYVGYISPVALSLGVISVLLFPIFINIGILISMAPTIFKPEFFSRKISYWYLFSIFIISMELLSLIYTIYMTTEITYIFSPLILIIFFIIECSFLIRYIKHEDTQGNKEIADIGIVSVFTRPDNITEEEISISKEKKICLTCKNKLGRFMYMCPDCHTFYCEKCVRILSDLENICWICYTPFDESKPYTLPEQKEEEEEPIIDHKALDQKIKDDLKEK